MNNIFEKYDLTIWCHQSMAASIQWTVIVTTAKEPKESLESQNSSQVLNFL